MVQKSIKSDIFDLKPLELAEQVYDVNFKLVKKWKDEHPGKKVIGTFPVYAPHELIHAMGHLPVNIFGGGEEVSISHADAILGSFICSISKSTTELMLSNPNFQEIFDGFIFPFICDVARNLSGIFARRSTKPAYMLHLAQNVESKSSVDYLTNEYKRMLKTIFPEEKIDNDNLKKSIELYNRNLELIKKILSIRHEKPWNVPLKDLYLTQRIGSQLPIDKHNEFLESKIDEYKNNNNRTRDAIRVVISGNFCEQPPIDIIDLIEQVGCYIIDDEFMIGRRFMTEPVKIDDEDPIRSLAKAYIEKGSKTATRYHRGEKGEHILKRVKEAKADGVIFLTAKFCEPALDDLVLQQIALNDNNIPNVHIEFEERGSGYENTRLSLETFVESMLFD